MSRIRFSPPPPKRQNHLDKSLIPRMYDSKEYALEDNLNSEFSNWEQQDNMLLSWLLASLSEPIQIWMVGCIYAYHIWDKIEKFFASYPRAKVCQLKFKLKSTKKQASMTAYLLEIKKALDQLVANLHQRTHWSYLGWPILRLHTSGNIHYLCLDPYSIEEMEALLLISCQS